MCSSECLIYSYDDHSSMCTLASCTCVNFICAHNNPICLHSCNLYLPRVSKLCFQISFILSKYTFHEKDPKTHLNRDSIHATESQLGTQPKIKDMYLYMHIGVNTLR